MQRDELDLFSERTGICIIDVQERLAAAMPDKVLKGTLRNCLNLIEAARVLGMPVVVSEQCPKGLGQTLPVIAESVLRLPRERVFFFEKEAFDCTEVPVFERWIRDCGRAQWIVAGMEAHVCVYQTVRGLARRDLLVHVPRDAVVSRTMANWEIGLKLVEKAGGLVTATEVVLFDLLKRAGTAEFKLLSRIIK